MSPVRSPDDLVAEARAQIGRVTPADARALSSQGALLIDIRPEAQRVQFGSLRGAVVIERNVLEWRLDPNGDYRIPEVRDHEQPLIVFCQEGYASSLAAASLAKLGHRKASDMIGGFDAWKCAGFPVA